MKPCQHERVCLQSVLAYHVQKCIPCRGRSKKRSEVKAKVKGYHLESGSEGKQTEKQSD